VDERRLNRVLRCVRKAHERQIRDEQTLRESGAVITMPRRGCYVAIKADDGSQRCADFLVFLARPPKLIVIAIEAKAGGRQASTAYDQLQGALKVAQQTLTRCGVAQSDVAHVSLWVHGNGVTPPGRKLLRRQRTRMFGRKQPVEMRRAVGQPLSLDDFLESELDC